MNRKLTTFFLWCLCGLVLTFSTSCGNQTNSNLENSSGELKFWTMQLKPKFTEYFNDLNNRYEPNNPDLKVDWVDVPWSAMESKILTAVSANTAPDVANLNPNFASLLASRNVWLNLEGKVSPEKKEEYLSKVWDANTIEVCEVDQCELNNFGIPWYLTTVVTIYNQDLLAQAGIEKVPTTFAEAALVAKQVKEKTGKYGFFVTFVPGDSNEVLESFVQMGVTLVDSDGKAAFNTPEGKEAFEYWVNLYQQDLLPPEVMTQGHRHALTLYQAGEVALLSTGTEFIKSIENNAPTIYKNSLASPQITGKTGKKNVAVMNLVIPNNTKKAEEAIKYALFVTNADNQLAFTKAADVLPSNRLAINEYIEQLKAKENISLLDKAKEISAIQLEDAEVLIPPLKDTNKLQKIIYENLQDAMLKEKTVEQAINDAESEWNSLVMDN